MQNIYRSYFLYYYYLIQRKNKIINNYRYSLKKNFFFAYIYSNLLNFILNLFIVDSEMLFFFNIKF